MQEYRVTLIYRLDRFGRQVRWIAETSGQAMLEVIEHVSGLPNGKAIMQGLVKAYVRPAR